MEFALAIHGGAGVIQRDLDPATRKAFANALRHALTVGRDLLAAGGTALDVVEQTVRVLEDEPLFNAGRGAVFTHAGEHELDAAIMDGSTLGCGAVAAVKTVRNPVSLARQVMQRTRHVLLVGAGAEQFADEAAVERVENGYFSTERRRRQWEEALEREKGGPMETFIDGGTRGTVGCVARDRHGNLAAATSTGGLSNKRWGRVGDSPVIGAGTYANNATVAVSCTGTGEEFMRHLVAHAVHMRMELLGEGLDAAAAGALGKLKTGDGGLIAVDRNGGIAVPYNSEGMYRGVANAAGRFEVGIWETAEP